MEICEITANKNNAIKDETRQETRSTERIARNKNVTLFFVSLGEKEKLFTRSSHTLRRCHTLYVAGCTKAALLVGQSICDAYIKFIESTFLPSENNFSMEFPLMFLLPVGECKLRINLLIKVKGKVVNWGFLCFIN